MEMIRTTLFLPKEFHRALKDLSAKKHLSMAALVKKALEVVYFKKKKNVPLKKFYGICKGTNLSYEKIKDAEYKYSDDWLS